MLACHTFKTRDNLNMRVVQFLSVVITVFLALAAPSSATYFRPAFHECPSTSATSSTANVTGGTYATQAAGQAALAGEVDDAVTDVENRAIDLCSGGCGENKCGGSVAWSTNNSGGQTVAGPGGTWVNKIGLDLDGVLTCKCD